MIENLCKVRIRHRDCADKHRFHSELQIVHTDSTPVLKFKMASLNSDNYLHHKWDEIKNEVPDKATDEIRLCGSLVISLPEILHHYFTIKT